MSIEKLYDVISDALQKPVSQISEEKKIFIDFQIESVEALELEFALEEAFDVKFETKDLWKLPSYLINNNMIENGTLTKVAYREIHCAFPGFDEETIQSIKLPSDIYKYIRIADIRTFITDKNQKVAA